MPFVLGLQYRFTTHKWKIPSCFVSTCNTNWTFHHVLWNSPHPLIDIILIRIFQLYDDNKRRSPNPNTLWRLYWLTIRTCENRTHQECPINAFAYSCVCEKMELKAVTRCFSKYKWKQCCWCSISKIYDTDEHALQRFYRVAYFISFHFISCFESMRVCIVTVDAAVNEY